MRASVLSSPAANRQSRERKCYSARFLLLECQGDGVADFKFLARDTSLPYADDRLPSIASAAEGPLFVATKPELREYKCVYVLNDEVVAVTTDSYATLV